MFLPPKRRALSELEGVVTQKTNFPIFFHIYSSLKEHADHIDRAVKGMKRLRSLEHWGRGFESHLKNGCLIVFILCLCEVAALLRADLSSKESCRMYFFYLVCEAVSTAATPGLLCQPLVILKMIVEKQMECRLAGETEVLGENLPQRHFCPSQKTT
jgi:hypothetical protein